MTTKRTITGRKFTKTPTVRLTQLNDSTFVGTLLGSRETKFGLAFQFAVLDGTAPIQIRTEDGTGWVDVDVKQGDKVDVLTSEKGQLETKLNQVKPGETAEIIYKGRDLNPKTGRNYNDF